MANRFLLLFSLYLLCTISTVNADETLGPERILLGNDAILEMGTHLEYLPDPNKDFSPFEIVLPEWADAWEQYDEGVFNLGYIDEAYWLRMNIDSSASIYKQWDLVVSTPMHDYIDVYQLFEDSGPRLIYRSGLKRAYNNRNEDHRYFIVPLEIYNETYNPDSFLIRIETRNSSYMPMQLYPANQFWAPLQIADVYNWMFFGIILAMALYNLFLFISVRDVSYLFYVLFISSFAFLHLSLDGYIFQHFWPSDKPYSPIPETVFSTFSVFFGFLFITHFLNLKTHLPWMHRGILIMVFLQIPLITGSIYYPDVSVENWLVPILGIMLVSAVIVGIFAYQKGLVTARYFIVAWVTFAIGNLYLIIVLKGTNLLPVSPLIISKLAAFTEAMLLSFALARRIRVLSDEREKQKLKAEAQSYFLAQISHEIRTPLNGVLGTVDLLDQTKLNTEQQSYVDIIQSSGKSLLTLVNDVLDYSKIEAGKMSVNEEQISVHELVKQQVELFRSHANQKNLELSLEVDDKVPNWVITDGQRLRQVWSNLISNAVKFTDRGFVKVRLSVEFKQQNPFLVLSIKDSGIGIGAKDLDSLFNAYQQVEFGKRQVYGGTGLGLAISKELMALLGGDISVESQLNQGSEFKIWAPLKSVAQNNQSTNEAQQGQTRSLSILVAEDNIVNQKVIEGLLKKLGHSVVIVPQGDHVVEQRRHSETHYDLIFMDCEMPIMDGYEATKRIREFEAQKNMPRIPIVALTAHALDEVRTRCMESGMDSFLTKPINTEQLNRTFNSIFVAN